MTRPFDAARRARPSSFRTPTLRIRSPSPKFVDLVVVGKGEDPERGFARRSHFCVSFA